MIRKVVSETPRAYQRTPFPFPGSGISGMAREAAIGSRMAVVSQGKESSSFAASGWSVEISAAAASCASPLTHSSGEGDGHLLVEPESEANYGNGTKQDTTQSDHHMQNGQDSCRAHIKASNLLMGPTSLMHALKEM